MGEIEITLGKGDPHKADIIYTDDIAKNIVLNAILSQAMEEVIVSTAKSAAMKMATKAATKSLIAKAMSPNIAATLAYEVFSMILDLTDVEGYNIVYDEEMLESMRIGYEVVMEKLYDEAGVNYSEEHVPQEVDFVKGYDEETQTVIVDEEIYKKVEGWIVEYLKNNMEEGPTPSGSSPSGSTPSDSSPSGSTPSDSSPSESSNIIGIIAILGIIIVILMILMIL